MEQLNIIEPDNCAGTFKRTWLGTTEKCPCYTKKQIAAFYPQSKPTIAAAYANRPPAHKNKAGFALWNGTKVAVYPEKHFHPLRYKICGYVRCDTKDTYLLLYTSRLPSLLAYALLLLTVVFITAACYLDHTKHSNSSLPIDPGAADYRGEEKPYDPDKLTFDSITELRVPAGATKAEVLFRNPKSNQSYCVASLWIQQENGTWNELYQSQWIPPGQAVHHITLNFPLSAGNYPAYVKYTSYTKQRVALNSVVFHFTLAAE